jgi:hypothetical protein
MTFGGSRFHTIIVNPDDQALSNLQNHQTGCSLYCVRTFDKVVVKLLSIGQGLRHLMTILGWRYRILGVVHIVRQPDIVFAHGSMMNGKGYINSILYWCFRGQGTAGTETGVGRAQIIGGNKRQRCCYQDALEDSTQCRSSSCLLHFQVRFSNSLGSRFSLAGSCCSDGSSDRANRRATNFCGWPLGVYQGVLHDWSFFIGAIHIQLHVNVRLEPNQLSRFLYLSHTMRDVSHSRANHKKEPTMRIFYLRNAAR